ncbi:MAG: hypothetical protein EA339_04540 [Rhodobacteraceae bacterium]|nr:MAG: hypothetical protein EA339_04540 [Paracoccaceae bacterium]
MGPIQSFQEFYDFLRRRWPVILLGLGLGLCIGVFIALRNTPVFQAVAILSTRVESVSEDAVRGTPAGSSARLMQLIEQRLTSRENMLRIADDYGLFMALPAQQRAEMMRQSITLLSQAAVNVGFGSDGALASMVIMVRAPSGETSAAIANELAQIVVQETGAGRTARAQQTLDFLRTEEARLAAELDALRAEARAFSTENANVMSFSAEMRRAELARLIDAMETTRSEIDAAEAELEGLSAQNVSPRRQVQLRETLSVRRSELARLEQRQTEFEPFFQSVAEAERVLGMFGEREARLQDRISDVAGQVAAAEAALRLEADSRSATFEIVEQATAPQFAITRSKRQIARLAVIAGGLLAVLAAFSYEVLRPALRSTAQVQRELGMRPVLVLPALVLPAERRRTRLQWGAIAGAVVLTLLAILTLSPR